jgi:hypothetical protein
MWKKLKSALNANNPSELTTIVSAPNPQRFTEYQKALVAAPVCNSDKFPNVLKPEAPTVPELLAARWAACDIRPEQIPALAADLLEAGLDTPTMRRLAGTMRVECRADVEELIAKMFKELGIKAPDSEVEAKMLSTRHIAREVISGLQNPWKAASVLERIWNYEIWHHKYLCDIAQLIDEVHWDPPYGREFSTLNSELLEMFALLGARAVNEKRPLRLGLLEGQGWIADDFDAPLPDDLQALFEGRDEPPA